VRKEYQFKGIFLDLERGGRGNQSDRQATSQVELFSVGCRISSDCLQHLQPSLCCHNTWEAVSCVCVCCQAGWWMSGGVGYTTGWLLRVWTSAKLKVAASRCFMIHTNSSGFYFTPGRFHTGFVCGGFDLCCIGKKSKS